MRKTDEIIGKKLREIRLRNGETLKGCGELIGVTHSTYHGYEKGIRSISAIDLVTILNHFNADVNKFFREVIEEDKQ